MAFLTSADNKNLSLFISNQKKIFRRNQLLSQAAHIGSHTITRVWRCTDEYECRDPVKLDSQFEMIYEQKEGIEHENWLKDVQEVSEMAIVTQWFFDETGCNTISCNPYYPGKGTCKNGLNEKEAPFSFTTGHNQRIDACQPICYDADRVKKTYVGMMSLYAPKDNMCFCTDPALIAFYLDPHRRLFDTEVGVLEKSAFKIGLEYLGPTGVPAVVAKIDSEYCNQFGLDYVEEKNELDGYTDLGNTVYGRCKVDKREGDFTALSTWTGDTIARAYNFGRNTFMGLIKDTSKNNNKKYHPPSRGPTTLKYLANEQSWLSHVDERKKPLPFPLKLIDLGLNYQNDGLMWTDEYSFMDDGRNDMYGGRLVEKPRNILRPAWATMRFDNINLNDFKSTERTRRDVIDNADNSEIPATFSAKSACETDCSMTEETEHNLFRGIDRNIEEYRKSVTSLSGLKGSIVGSSFEVITGQIIAGTTVESLGDILGQYSGETLKSNSSAVKQAVKSLIQKLGGNVSTKCIGTAVIQTTIRTRIESQVVTRSASLLQLPFRALARGANILTLISLFGAALDIFSAFIYNPYSKYEHYFSDRLLRAMAEAELVTTQRLIGCQRLLLEPSEWMVNTRYLDTAKDSMYDMLLGLIYLRSRRINSDGSIIYWFGDGCGGGGLRSESNGQLVYFEKTTESYNNISGPVAVPKIHNKPEKQEVPPNMNIPFAYSSDGDYMSVYSNIPFKYSLNGGYISILWYVMFLFVLFTAIALTGLSKAATMRFMIPLGILAKMFVL